MLDLCCGLLSWLSSPVGCHASALPPHCSVHSVYARAAVPCFGAVGKRLLPSRLTLIATSGAVCGRVFGNWAVVSFYGYAAVADVPTVSAVLREAAALQRPCVVLGDFNWRPAYEDLVRVFGGSSSPAVPCVQGSALACPTRAVGLGGLRLQQASVSTMPLPGIPHHHAVVVSTLWPAASGFSPAGVYPGLGADVPLRYRRCATYSWLSKPSPAQSATLRQASEAPPGPKPCLVDAFASWHRRAEAACATAVTLGLASRDRCAERPKGSLPTTRPVASPCSSQAFRVLSFATG